MLSTRAIMNHFDTLKAYEIFARIAACQDLADEADARYRKLNTDIALRELENNGFRDAADFLRSKISDIGRIEHGEINRMDTRRTQSNPENGFTE